MLLCRCNGRFTHSCAGHAGHAALVGYGATDKPPYLLAVLPSGTEGLSAEQMEETARLGVLLTPTVPFGKADVYARVFVGGSVASYVLTCGGDSLAAAPNAGKLLARVGVNEPSDASPFECRSIAVPRKAGSLTGAPSGTLPTRMCSSGGSSPMRSEP